MNLAQAINPETFRIDGDVQVERSGLAPLSILQEIGLARVRVHDAPPESRKTWPRISKARQEKKKG